MATENKMPTKVVGGEVRFSYAHVFEAKLNEQSGKKQFSCALLIPKKNKALTDKIKAGINAAIEAGITKTWGGKKPNPSKLKIPLRDGDAERPDNPEYKGMWFISANSNNRPGIVDEDCNAILDESDFYSGCWGNFSVNFFPYNQKGNVGVGAGLLNLQKTRDDEKLSGSSTPQEDFGSSKTANVSSDKDEEENPFGDDDDELPY